MFDVYGKAYSCKKKKKEKKCWQMDLRLVWYCDSEVEKTFHEIEMHWLSGKENVLGAAVSKGCYIGSLQWYEKDPWLLISLKTQL